MRFRLTLVAALSAVALSAAPAQSTDFWAGNEECEPLLPQYWLPLGPQLCPLNGKEWQLTPHA